jgi:AcrR family transcriptional regulator
VRAALIAAGVELARSGGPDAVVLREVTRMVGVVPNAAYRYFAHRDALLAASIMTRTLMCRSLLCRPRGRWLSVLAKSVKQDGRRALSSIENSRSR